MSGLRAALSVLLLGALPACLDGDRTCYPSDWRACTCAGGAPGYQQCDASGDAYGSCDCSGTIPGLTTGATSSASGSGGGGQGAGGTGGDAGSGGAALKAFLEDCELGEDCESGICHNFPAKGPKCTLQCAGSGDCPPPSTGCNMMGVCKAP